MKTTKALLQQAAEAGPGWRGKRTALDESQRQHLTHGAGFRLYRTIDGFGVQQAISS